MLIMTTGSGMFHAATAYLPSTFAMYSTMLGVAAFMDWRGGLRTAQGIFWFGVGGILGWPFAAALVLPFMLEELLIASLSGELFGFIGRSLDGSVRSLIVLVCQKSKKKRTTEVNSVLGSSNRCRCIFLQETRLRPLEYRFIQHFCRILQRPKYIRH